jgi:ferrous iron transport protein B
VSDPGESILAKFSGLLVPVMNPLGLGDWRICTSLISGFMAKESVVSTFNVLFGSNVGTVLNSASAVSMLVFSLLYTPCVASIAAIKRELGLRWSLGVVVWQCFIAWIAASIAHLIMILITGS